jgi:hypothetical protein
MGLKIHKKTIYTIKHTYTRVYGTHIDALIVTTQEVTTIAPYYNITV